MSDQRYLYKFNDDVIALKHGVIVMDVSELITKKEHGCVKTELTDKKLELKKKQKTY